MDRAQFEELLLRNPNNVENRWNLAYFRAILPEADMRALDAVTAGDERMRASFLRFAIITRNIVNDDPVSCDQISERNAFIKKLDTLAMHKDVKAWQVWSICNLLTSTLIGISHREGRV